MKRLASALDAVPWALVDGLRVPWAAYDRARPHGDHHAYLDRFVAQIKANGVFHPYSFYSQGYGDTSLLPRLARELPRLGQTPVAPLINMILTSSPHGRDTAVVLDAAFDSPAADRALLPPASRTAHAQLVVPSSWLADQQQLLPAPAAAGGASAEAVAHEMRRLRPVVVLLPGTGEQGFRRRRHCVAYPLADMGIATVILEGPFYGRRRPPEQAASKLARYTDLLVLGRSTLEEARALVAWLQPAATNELLARVRAPRGLDCGCVVLAGTSMGGLHAAMTACHLPPHLGERTGVVSWLGPPTAAPVFTLGALRAGVAWRALAQQADPATPAGRALEAHLAAMEAALPPDPPGCDHAADVAASEARQRGGAALARGTMTAGRHGGSGGGGAPALLGASHVTSAATPQAAVAHARRQLARVSRVSHLTLHPPPRRPDAAIFTRAAHDQYIPDTPSVQAMWRAIAGGGGAGGPPAAWPGCELRTIRGGHVSSSVFALEEYCRCIVEAVRRVQRR